MNRPFYDFETSEDTLRFEFDSVSPQKHIRKVVEYTPLPDNPRIYNLGFGDLREDGNIDDLIVSNNQDMEMILSTVVQTIFKFFELKPTNTIIFLGSTKSRTRLYQIVITKYLLEAADFLTVRGIRNGRAELFVENQNYEAFLINIKK